MSPQSDFPSPGKNIRSYLLNNSLVAYDRPVFWPKTLATFFTEAYDLIKGRGPSEVRDGKKL